jgi:hypothetical protein
VRLIGAVVIGGTAYTATRILQYSDEYPLWVTTCIPAAGLLAAVGWTLELPSAAKRILWAMLVCSLVGGPVATNFYTLASSQEGTNPISGPISNNSGAISRHLEEIRQGNPAWAKKIAYGDTPSADVLAEVTTAGPEATWIAATYSAQNAAQYQLATGRPVMAIGGWLGTDPAPSLDAFISLVAKKQVAYFIWQEELLELDQLGPETVAISEWVREHFRSSTIDGVRVYDLADDMSAAATAGQSVR